MSFFSSLEHEVLSRHHFTTREEARKVVVEWAYGFYNSRRRHSSCGMKSPMDRWTDGLRDSRRPGGMRNPPRSEGKPTGLHHDLLPPAQRLMKRPLNLAAVEEPPPPAHTRY